MVNNIKLITKLRVKCMIIINAKLKVSEEHREAYLDLMTNLVKHA